MKNIRFFVAILSAGLLAIFLPACGGGGKGLRDGAEPTPKLASLSVSPDNPSIPVGVTKQFAASGIYSNGTSRDLTREVTWRSSNPRVTTVNSDGLATSIDKGTAIITAAFGKISGRMTLTVTPATLSSIAVMPPNLILSGGSNHQFTANGRYSDGASYDITNRVTWNSSNPSIATVNKDGLVKAVGTGTATIHATLGTVTGNRALTVASFLSSISVTPADLSMPVGTYKLFTATGTYSDGTSSQIRTGTWKSANMAAAKVDPSGLVTAVAAGTTIITATEGKISGKTTVTVTPLTLSSISVSHASRSLPAGVTQQFRATGIYSEKTINDLTVQVTWSSSNPSVATVNEKGLVTTIAAGTTKITATSGPISGSTTLTVTSK